MRNSNPPPLGTTWNGGKCCVKPCTLFWEGYYECGRYAEGVGDWMATVAVDHGFPLNAIIFIIERDVDKGGTLKIFVGGNGNKEAAVPTKKEALSRRKVSERVSEPPHNY